MKSFSSGMLSDDLTVSWRLRIMPLPRHFHDPSWFWQRGVFLTSKKWNASSHWRREYNIEFYLADVSTFSLQTDAVVSACLPKPGRGGWVYLKISSVLTVVFSVRQKRVGENSLRRYKLWESFSLWKSGGNSQVWISWKTSVQKGTCSWVFIYVF